VSGEGAAVPALAFSDVAVRMGDRDVLRGIDLEVAPGEVVALVGPNGAGKTTLLRVASRVLRPARGRVTLGGRASESLSRRELAREVAVVPQDVVIPFAFRAGEVVLMGRAPHAGPLGFETSDDVARARDCLERVGIADLADRSMLELSGGERQLVLVARALVQEPRVLLLDEPTSHLDLRHRVDVLELVREFTGLGRSALVVSHDLTLAAGSCDRMALLRDGALLACGPPAQVLTRDALREVFDVDADVIAGPDDAPLVVPRTRAVAPLR
jgi:iron complex transport system ATP-binding protein